MSTTKRHLEEIRTSQGRSRAAFARAVGCGARNVWNWEQGGMPPRSDHKERCALILGVKVDSVIWGEVWPGRTERTQPQPQPRSVVDGQGDDGDVDPDW